jgi:hypothetical protein
MAPDVPSGVVCPLRRASLGGHLAEIVSGAAKVEEPTEVSDRELRRSHGVKYRATGAGHLTALTRQLTSQALRQEGTAFGDVRHQQTCSRGSWRRSPGDPQRYSPNSEHALDV